MVPTPPPGRHSSSCATVAWRGFGLVVGDPAVDLVVAWSLLDPAGRDADRTVLGVDDATWLRGRAWAVSAAAQAKPCYRLTSPDTVERSWRAAGAVLAGQR